MSVGETGSAFFGVGQAKLPFPTNIVTHGLVGGTAADLQGGHFGSGFISQAIAKSLSGPVHGVFGNNVFGGSIAEAVIGGTASELTGGKFANGAVTAAFGYLYNYCGAKLDCSQARGEEAEAIREHDFEKVGFFFEQAEEFLLDRLSINAGGTAAYGVGIEGGVRIDQEGAVLTGGYATGFGTSARATVDALIYDGGAITGYGLRGTACVGGGLGGCATVQFSPSTRNLRVYFGGGFVRGSSFAVRPFYNSRLDSDGRN